MKPKSSNRFLSVALTSLVSLSSSLFAVDIIKDDNTDSLNLGTSWGGASAPTGSDVAVWDSTVTGANSVDLGANLSWGGLRLDDPAGDVTLTGSNNLTLGADGLDTGSTANLTWNSSGNISLSKLSGSTTLTYDANNTTSWTGLTTVDFTGTLALRGGSGADGSFSNEWFAFGSSAAWTQTGSFHLDTGASLTDRRDVILTGGNTGGGNSVLSLSSLSGYGDFRSDWTGALGTRTISVNQSIDTEFQGRIDENNATTGAGGRSILLLKDGVGTLTLTGENVDHATTVSGGTLAVGNGGATGSIGAGVVSVASGATLEFNRTGLLDYKAKASMRNVSGAGDIVLDGGVKLYNYTGSGIGFSDANSWNNFSGNLIIKGGSEFQTIRNGATAMGTANVILGDGSTSGTLSQIEGNWAWTNNIQLVGSANTIANNATGFDRYLKIQGNISGTGGLTFDDTTGAMDNIDRGFILTGTNTMSAFTISSGDEVRVGGVGGESSSISAGNAGSIGTAAVTNDGTLTFSRSDSHTVAATISGGGAVRIGSTGITGSDTQVVTFSASHNYTGSTTVGAGTLLVNGSLGNTTVGVDAGGTLGGTGTIAGAVNVSGVLAPGASIETFATGDLSFTTGSTFAYEVDSTVGLSIGADLQKVTGTLSLSGVTELTLVDLATGGPAVAFAQDTVFTLINYTGSWNNGLFTYGGNELANGGTFNDGLNTWQIDYDAITGGSNFSGEYVAGNFVNITAVPEPAAALLGGVGMLMLLRRRRG